MDEDSHTNVVNDAQVEETDDSCRFEFIEIVPLVRDNNGSCTTECVSGDCSAEVKQENSSVVKQEKVIVVTCVMFILTVSNNFCRFLTPC